jgi:hypothetical protein
LLLRPDIFKVDVDGKRHYDTPDGRFPSVTTVLSILGKEKIVQWRKAVGDIEADAITGEAQRRGTKLHAAVERFLKKEDVGELDFAVKSHFLQIRDIISQIRPIGIELPLYSKKLKMAGTCDCIGHMGDELFVIDFKTARLRKEVRDIINYYLQCTAYGCMANELHGLNIQKFKIIIANLDEQEPSVFDGEMSQFLAALFHTRNLFDVQEKIQAAL